MTLTAGLDVTQVHPNLGVQGKAPGGLHLASRVTAEVVASPELWVFSRQVVTVWVLRAPHLTGMTRLSDADRPSVVSPSAVVTIVVRG